MHKKRIIGISLILGGLIGFLLNPLSTITGFTIASNNLQPYPSFYFLVCATLILVGMILSIDEKLIESRDSKETREFAWGTGRKTIHRMSEAQTQDEYLLVDKKKYIAFLKNKDFESPLKVEKGEIKFTESIDAFRNRYKEYQAKLKNEKPYVVERFLRELVQDLNRDKNQALEVLNITNRKLPKVVISTKGLRRLNNDSRCYNDRRKYVQEIARLASNPEILTGYHKIGDFMLQNGSGIKMPVYYDKEENTIHICDFLYHINEKDYVDHWNIKADPDYRGTDKITKKSYDSAKNANWEELVKL